MEQSELARRVNEYVYDTVLAWRENDRGSDSKVVFRCQCGCNRPVWRTLQEYDTAGGAWLAGHDDIATRPLPVLRILRR
jgi:hypothetical protein